MKNPLEDPHGVFLVLANAEGRYSLWPHFCSVPEGWTLTFGPQDRQACLEYIEQQWSDMRPNSLIAVMDAEAQR